MRFFGVILWLLSLNAAAFDGLVIDVHDGDSLTVLNEQGAAEKIRLHRADTPELKGTKWAYQPYAAEARSSLLNLCGGKIASITRHGQDRYHRSLGDINCQGHDVARWQIDNGAAWAYRWASLKALRNAQASAKAKGLGLWALPKPVEPYLWRKDRMH